MTLVGLIIFLVGFLGVFISDGLENKTPVITFILISSLGVVAAIFEITSPISIESTRTFKTENISQYIPNVEGNKMFTIREDIYFSTRPLTSRKVTEFTLIEE